MKLGCELGNLLRLIPLQMPDRAPRHVDAAVAKRLGFLRQLLGAILPKHGHAGLRGQQGVGYRKRFRNRNQANIRGIPAGGVGGIDEKSTYETSKYLLELEKNMGFKINTIQVDNGYEFVNDAEKTNRKTRFQFVAEHLGMKIKRTKIGRAHV